MQDDNNLTPTPVEPVTPPVKSPSETPVQTNTPAVQPAVNQVQPKPPQPETAPDATAGATLPTTPEPTNPSSQQPNVQPKQKREGGALSFIVTLLVAFALVQVINMFLFQSYKVFGSSMYSTLHDGDRLIISKIGRTESKITGKNFVPKRGEIIVFIDPQNTSIQLIKRVIGLPGERVVVKNGSITVYNKEHPEGFNPDDTEYGKNIPPSSGEKDVVVPEGHLFVSGDNRVGSNSLDSRNELGTVPEENIVGVLKVRIFPLNTSKFF